MKIAQFKQAVLPLKPYFKGREEEFSNMAMGLYTALYHLERRPLDRELRSFAVGVTSNVKKK